MKYTYYILAWLGLAGLPTLSAQVLITGSLYDETGAAVMSANVSIKGTYRGTTTDLEGYFSLAAAPQDTLVFSYLGYQDALRVVPEGQTPVTLNISLKPQANILTQATISAQRKAEAVRLASADLSQQQIFTTAGDPGNLLVAAQSGASTVVNPATGRLLARGGRANETQFYQDGLLLSNPYINTPTGINTRLQQNPYMVEKIELFNGTASVEYGQLLSSLFHLNTTSNVAEEQTNIALSTVGINANLARNTPVGDLIWNTDILDLTLANQLTNTEVNWEEPYRNLANQLLWNLPLQQQNQSLKLYANHAINRMGVNTNYQGEPRSIDLQGQQYNLALNYKYLVSDRWDVRLGGTYQNSDNATQIAEVLDEEVEHATVHLKSVARYYAPQGPQWKMGVEYFHNNHQQAVDFISDSFNVEQKLTDHNLAVFLEAQQEWRNGWSLRVGSRIDQLQRQRPFPLPSVRALLGYSLNDYWSMAASYGTYHQSAAAAFRYQAPGLRAESSEQMIFTVDYHRNRRAWNVSMYRKNYEHLVQHTLGFPFDGIRPTNGGDGQVNGLDLSFLDRQTLSNGEIRWSYSYLQSVRNDRFNAQAIFPGFLYPHQMTINTTKFLPMLSSNVSMSFVLADGKRQDNPFTLDEIEQDQLGTYANLSFNYTYLFKLFGRRISYLHFSVENITNRNNEVNWIYQPNGVTNLQYNNNRRSFFLALIANL